VCVQNKLQHIVTAIDLSQAIVRRIYRNYAFAMGYNLLSVHLSPHTTVCVLIPLLMCPHTYRNYAFAMAYNLLSPYEAIPPTTIHVASYHYMCPHTTRYVSSCHHIVRSDGRYRSQLVFCTPLLRLLIPLYICPRVLLIGTARGWRSVLDCSPAHPPA